MPSAHTSVMSRRRLFWTLQIGGWTATVPTLIVFNLLLGAPPAAAVVIGFSRQISGFLITLGLRRVYRRWLRTKPSPLRLIVPVLALVVLAALVDYVFLKLTFAALSPSFSGTPSRFIYLTSTLGRPLVIGSWSALYFLLSQALDQRDHESRLARAETAAREAELATLRAQVNPHFLFNALNSILADCDDDPASVRAITRSLADYLRASLLQQGHHAPLDGELAIIAGYLGVEQNRFEERLIHTLTVENAARGVLAPTAVLLPLVENAVKYGMRTSPSPLRIAVEARLRAGRLILAVENSGRWIEPRPDLADSTQIGLANLRRRLALLHGDDATLTIDHDADHVRVTVDVPAGEPSADATAARPEPHPAFS